MASLITPLSGINPTAILEYFDAMIVWLQQPLEGPALVRFEALCRGRLRQRTAPMRFQGDYRQCLWLRQPPAEALAYLAERNDTLVTYVEVARDYIFETASERRRAFEAIVRHVVKPYRRGETARIFTGLHDETFYSGERSKACNIVAYQGKPCRITGDLYCVHAEARFRGKGLKTAKLATVKEMLAVDKGALLDKRLRYFAINYEKLGRKIGIATNKRSMNRRSAIIVRHTLPSGKTFTYNEDKRRGQIIARKYGLTKEQFVFRAKGATTHELEALHTTQNVIDRLKAHKAFKHVDVMGCLMPVSVFANNDKGNQGDMTASVNNGDTIIGKRHPCPVKLAKKGM